MLKITSLLIILLSSLAVNAQNFDERAEDLITPLQLLKSRASTNTIDDFRTDQCTMSPEFIPVLYKGNWAHCCIEHDIYHWAAGNRAQRKIADKKLEQCINKAGGPGYIYYSVVNSMGHPSMLIGTKVDGRNSPWGYGWNYYIGHDSLNEEQQESVCNKFEKWKTSEETKDQFTDFYNTYTELQGEEPYMPDCD